jgi:hypothetical protein
MPASHIGALVSVPVDFILNSWWTKWHASRFFSNFLRFSPTKSNSTIVLYLSITVPWNVRCCCPGSMLSYPRCTSRVSISLTRHLTGDWVRDASSSYGTVDVTAYLFADPWAQPFPQQCKRVVLQHVCSCWPCSCWLKSLPRLIGNLHLMAVSLGSEGMLQVIYNSY